MKWIYDLMYRYSVVPIPYDVGPREELVRLVESERVKPCRAIDLGSGTACNVIYLAQHGFDVTGVDYSPAAIEMGRDRAREAGVEVTFIEDDLTKPRHVNGKFDLLVDYGCLHSIHPKDRSLYVQNVQAMAQPGSTLLLWCFEWPMSWIERLSRTVAVRPGEVECRFDKYFDVERIGGTNKPEDLKFFSSFGVYLMKRKSV